MSLAIMILFLSSEANVGTHILFIEVCNMVTAWKSMLIVCCSRGCSTPQYEIGYIGTFFTFKIKFAQKAYTFPFWFRLIVIVVRSSSCYFRHIIHNVKIIAPKRERGEGGKKGRIMGGGGAEGGGGRGRRGGRIGRLWSESPENRPPIWPPPLRRVISWAVTLYSSKNNDNGKQKSSWNHTKTLKLNKVCM